MIVAATLMGTAAAVKEGTFAWRKLSDVFQKTVPMVVAYAAVGLWQQPGVDVAVLALIVASLSGGIVRNLAIVFPSLEPLVPETMKR